MTIKEAVNSSIYKEFKYLYQHQIYNEDVYKKATFILNRALQEAHAFGTTYLPLRVNYAR